MSFTGIHFQVLYILCAFLIHSTLTHVDSLAKNRGILGYEGTGPKTGMLFCDGFNVQGTCSGFKVAAVSNECQSVNRRPSGIFNNFFVNDDLKCAIYTVSPKRGSDTMSMGFAGTILF